MKHLLEGYRAFRAGRWPIEREHYEALAKRGQSPEYLIISCSDSRADPATIFDSSPGELFVVRNVAGVVPPCENDSSYHGTSAALAFAVLQLKVRNILVLGHAQCGGVAAALERKLIAVVPVLDHWLDLMEPALEHSKHILD